MSIENIHHSYLSLVKNGSSQELRAVANDTAAGTLTEGISIYTSNTKERLVATLEAAFPVCKKVVGNDCFQAMAEEYALQYPSEEKSLYHYGAKFNQFTDLIIKTNEQFYNVAYLPDLALFEWKMHLSFFQKDRTAFDFDRFANLEQSQLSKIVFTLSPDIYLLETQFPVAIIWELHEINEPFKKAIIEKGKECYLIERPLYKPTFTHLKRHEFDALTKIEAGFTFENLILSFGNFETLVTEFIKNGWVNGFKNGLETT
ncbi:MAG: hypothetical protein CMN85_06645 [Spongiibacteraceae bacterium]|nr:hypothetical protein [Spongiibacteraceae bacterium]|tara:strand:+ start:548 stop:1324 length:777 start_codon:yes stop_codon:yes gene_type:complete